MDKLDVIEEIEQLANTAKNLGENCAGIVLFSLVGAMRLDDEAEVELARICKEYSRFMLKEIEKRQR